MPMTRTNPRASFARSFGFVFGMSCSSGSKLRREPGERTYLTAKDAEVRKEHTLVSDNVAGVDSLRSL